MASKSSSSQAQTNKQADNRVSGDGIVVGGSSEALIASVQDGGTAIGQADSITITDFSEETIERILNVAGDIAEGAFDTVGAASDDNMSSIAEALGVNQEAIEEIGDTASAAFDLVRSSTDNAIDALSENSERAFSFANSLTEDALEEVNSGASEAFDFVERSTNEALSLVAQNTSVALEAARSADARISEFAIAATVAAAIGIVMFTSNQGFLA